jgi:hypothetical protein
MRRVWLLAVVAVVGCGKSSPAMPPSVTAVIDFGRRAAWMAHGEDPWEVVVCHVPADTASPVYAGLPLRTLLSADALVAVFTDHVTSYFNTLSHGQYRPTFAAGPDVSIAAADEPQVCVDRALQSSPSNAHGVLVVADAEHNVGQPGGFANPGSRCTKAPCDARTSRRSAYVGAADFGTEWGDRPLLDLVEHELGHALFWPHSSYDESVGEPHTSALDVMSNSAAPRDTNPDRRDAPDTLAINRLSVGWLPVSAVRVVGDRGASVALSPSTGTSGTMLAVIGLDDGRFITVELLSATGFDDHLPHSGIAVHLVVGSDENRTQQPLAGVAPYADLVDIGETLTTNGWRISVGAGWRVTIQPVADGRTVTG